MKGLFRRAAEIMCPTRLDRESGEELSYHTELLVARKVASGIEEHEARRQAVAEIGAVSSACEQIAEERTGFALGQLARELRSAARVLRRSSGVTLLSIGTIGLGIGVSTVLITLVTDIVLRPLPYSDPERLVRVFDTNPRSGVDRAGVASGNLNDWRRRAGVFDGIAGYYVMGRTASFDGDADVLITAQVGQDFFEVLRMAPELGRPFTEDEMRRASFNSAAAPTGADPVAMLSHSVWVQRFGADPEVLGQSLALDRRLFRIVGVMPAAFAMPDPGVQIWIPWNISDDDPRDQHYLGALARVKAGVSIAQAERRLDTVARELGAEFPATNSGWGVHLSPLAVETVGETATTLWVMLGSVGLFLLIACANVGLLSLLRGFDRRRETAIRAALGASSARLLREFCFESVLLALLGGFVGAAIAAIGFRVLPWLTPDLPRLSEVTVDCRALGLVAALASSSAMLSGLPQALRCTRRAPFADLSAGTFHATKGVENHWLRNVIVVMHVALAVVLMTGSGLFVRSFYELRGTDPGFDPRGVLVAPIFLDNQAYNTGEKVRTYYRTLFGRLAGLPGVIAVGGATTVPTSPLGPDFERPVWPEGSVPDPAGRIPASVRMVTPDFFRVMGLPVVSGRSFDDRDSPKAPRVLMVSATLAKRIWPGDSAVGKRLVVDYSTAGTYPYEVVGVVGDLKPHGPRSKPLAEIYLPHAQRSYLILNVVVKTAGDPRSHVPAVRAALKGVDPQMPAHGVSTLEDLVGATYARDRQMMITLCVFASAATFLAVLSVYGVLAYRVRQRSRDIGIRMALGADAGRVIKWVLGSGLRLLALGLAGGAVTARALGGVLDGLLFGVPSTDGLTTLMVIVTLGGIGILASLAASWRATRIDPVEVLRRA